MPRVVPSDVVQATEKMFPEIIKDPKSRPGFGVDALPPLQALVHLVEAVPTELVRLDPAEYASLTSAVAALRGAIDMYASPKTPSGYAFHLRGYDSHPIAMVHEAMKACPDEAVADGTTRLDFIEDEGLRESIRLDLDAANQSLEAGKWKGATVLAGAAVEALLLWGLQQLEAESPGSLAQAVKELLANGTLKRKPTSNDPEDWVLHQYVEVAEHLAVIEENTATLVRLAKDFRNLIHPGATVRLGEECSRATALTAIGAVEAVINDINPDD